MLQKGKISTEKIAAVEAWLQGRMSKHGIARNFGIAKKTLLRWIMLYEAQGREGLMCSPQNKRYSAGVKIREVDRNADIFACLLRVNPSFVGVGICL